MASINILMEDISLYSTIKLWGKYDWPVYELKQLNSRSAVESAISSKNSYIGPATNQGVEAPITLIAGYPYQLLMNAINEGELLDPLVETPSTIIDEVEIDYNGYIGETKIVVASSNQVASANSIVTLDDSYNVNMGYANWEQSVTKGEQLFANMGNNMNGVYGTFVEDGIRYYYRMGASFTFLDTSSKANLSVVLQTRTYSGTRGAHFFGMSDSAILPLSQIGDGTFSENTDPNRPGNPYEPNGPSGPGDLPPGTFDDNSNPIPDSPIPTLSAANTGFTRIYNPTISQVQQLAKYLWTDDTVIETIWNHIKQYFEDPMQAIIGFNLVPVPVPGGGTQSFALMYIDTGVEMTVAANQFVDVDCGTLSVERYYGSALDQSPYTKITCFLPYIGQVQLDTDEVMGTTLQVKYRVDIVTGSCVAKIFVDGNCLYQYTGHCAINIPISSADFSSYVSSAISIARLATTAGLAASGIVAPPTPVTTTQQTNKTTTTNTDTARNPATGRQITMGTHTTSIINETNKEVTTSQASFDGLSPQNISNTVGQIMGSKAIVQHSGSFSGNSGYLGVRRPYLIIERPNICLPANYQQLNGYPAMITMALSSCQGYTQVQQVQLTGLTATNPEQAEILSLLKGGVIF